eukprot:s42_g29.t1
MAIANPLGICSDLAISCLMLPSSWCHALDSPSASLRECQSWCSTCQKLQAITELAMLCTVSENRNLTLRRWPLQNSTHVLLRYIPPHNHSHCTKLQRLRTHARMAYRKIGRSSS